MQRKRSRHGVDRHNMQGEYSFFKSFLRAFLQKSAEPTYARFFTKKRRASFEFCKDAFIFLQSAMTELVGENGDSSNIIDICILFVEKIISKGRKFMDFLQISIDKRA